MKTMYKILFIIFLIPLTIMATEKKGKYTKSKIIKKEFKVTNDATLNITNKYGNVVIATWNENKINIDVTITTNGNDEEKVEKRLAQIDVDFNTTTNYVSAKTMIKKSSISWNIWGKNNNVNIQIDYIIKMPITNNIDLSNDYGSISLDKLKGTSEINCDYGKINIGELLNTSNHIKIDYTDKSTIDFMKGGEIDADYSTLYIEKSGKTKLNADYSYISFGMVVSLDYNCDYGDLKIEDCGNLTGNSDYMHTNVGILRGSGDFDTDYGSIKINELGENFKNLKIESTYTNLKFSVKASTSFNITASLNYGSLKYGSGFTFSKEIKKNTSKQYEGYYNSSNSDNNITIKSSFGNITFTKN